MKKLIFILLILLSAVTFGQTTVQDSIAAARAYNNANIVTNGTKTITAVKVNTAINRVLNAVKAVNDSIPRNAIGYLIKMTTGPNGIPKINVDSTKLDSLIRSLAGSGGGFQTLAQTLLQGNATNGNSILVSDGDNLLLSNGSLIRKGINDEGTGGNGGIEFVCSVGYPLKWEGGVLYSKETDGVTNRPLILNSPLKIVDGTEGAGKILISDATGLGTWGTPQIPTLQQVTTAGSSTTNSVFGINSFVGVTSTGTSSNEKLAMLFTSGSTSGTLQLRNSTSPFASANIRATNITGSGGRFYELPDKSGTFAMTSDLGATINTKYNEEITSTGSTTITFANPYISNTIRLYRNGVRLSRSLWTETTSTTITLTFTPNAGDKFLSDYNY